MDFSAPELWPSEYLQGYWHPSGNWNWLFSPTVGLNLLLNRFGFLFNLFSEAATSNNHLLTHSFPPAATFFTCASVYWQLQEPVWKAFCRQKHSSLQISWMFMD